jgi:hypothetical protein
MAEGSSRKMEWEKAPIYKKAWEIMELVDKLVDSVKKTDIEYEHEASSHMVEHSLSDMRSNAMIIPAKIAGAWGADLYDLKMENAAIIRKAARDLILGLRSLQMNGYKDIEYLDLLRDEIEEFRVLFAEWVKTFDPWDYIIDRWGLFNPPGVNYDDKDPDDDIPFDPNDLPFGPDDED